MTVSSLNLVNNLLMVGDLPRALGVAQNMAPCDLRDTALARVARAFEATGKFSLRRLAIGSMGPGPLKTKYQTLNKLSDRQVFNVDDASVGELLASDEPNLAVAINKVRAIIKTLVEKNDFPRIFLVLQSLKSNGPFVLFFLNIAQKVLEDPYLGMPRALQIVEMMEPGRGRDQVIEFLIPNLNLEGDFSEAIRLASMIRNPYFKNECLATIISKLVAVHNLTLAIQAAKHLDDKEPNQVSRNLGLKKVIQALINSSRLPEALAIASRLLDDEMFCILIEKYLEQDNISKALEIARLTCVRAGETVPVSEKGLKLVVKRFASLIGVDPALSLVKDLPPKWREIALGWCLEYMIAAGELNLAIDIVCHRYIDSIFQFHAALKLIEGILKDYNVDYAFEFVDSLEFGEMKDTCCQRIFQHCVARREWVNALKALERVQGDEVRACCLIEASEEFIQARISQQAHKN